VETQFFVVTDLELWSEGGTVTIRLRPLESEGKCLF
jgi:hypothetical protein